MPEIESTEDYRLYAESLHYDELMDVFENIDCNTYPDRYEIVENLLSHRQKTGEITYSDSYEKLKQLPKGVSLIGAILLAGFVISLPVHIYEIVSEKAYQNIPVFIFYLLIPAILFLILYGIHKEREWVVSLVLIFSAYQVLGSFFEQFARQEVGFSDDIGRILAVTFYSYSIIVFSRRETKKFYKDSGTTVVQL